MEIEFVTRGHQVVNERLSDFKGSELGMLAHGVIEESRGVIAEPRYLKPRSPLPTRTDFPRYL